MDSPSNPIWATLDYNEQLILYYLAQVNQVVYPQQIAKQTGIYHTTVRTKLQVLNDLELIYITRRGKSKVVVITNKGHESLIHSRHGFITIAAYNGDRDHGAHNKACFFINSVRLGVRRKSKESYQYCQD